MKKVILWLLSVLLALVLAALIVVELLPRHFDSVKNVEISGSQCWMAELSDELSLGEISIPGAHDAGAQNVRLALFSKCQDLGTRQLLDAGFRYLDIRLGVEQDGGRAVLGIYHGFVNCLKGRTVFGGNLLLDDILEDCRDFLEENPTETILFVVKQEHGDESVKEFQEILSQYTDSDLWLLTDTMSTLGEARGKIVLFRRYDDEAGLGKAAGIYLGWSKQNERRETPLGCETADEGGFTAFVQDRYKLDTTVKWETFANTLAETDSLLEGGIVINFLSTNGSPAYGHPYKYAKELNSLFLSYDIPSKSAGWVIADFGNAEIAAKIYSLNFNN